MVLNILDVPDQFSLNRNQQRVASFYFAKQGTLRLKTKQNHKTKHHLFIHHFIKEETFTKGHFNTTKYTSS